MPSPEPQPVPGKETVPCARSIARGLLLLTAALAALTLTSGALVKLRPGHDSVRYLDGAERLIQGLPLAEKQGDHLAYLALVAVMQLAGWGHPGIAFVQHLAALAAVAALWDLGRRAAGPAGGLIAAGLMALNPDISRWHVYLLTDSLYTSLLAAAVWATARAADRRGGWYGVAAAVIVVTALVRPSGWTLALAGPLYWVWNASRSPRVRALATPAIVAAFLVAAPHLPGIHSRAHREAPVGTLQHGDVISGYPAASLPMPPEPHMETGWAGVLEYVLRHPAACIRLASARVGTELLHTRPFYSARHNLLVLACLLPLYGLAAAGLVTHRRHRFVQLTSLVIALHLLLIAGTYADWDGRWLDHLLPLFGFLAACGLVGLRRCWSSTIRLRGIEPEREPA
jgi:4-amino-4-deoxy-L-arabinose transferase-like glycosyltransferase